jgi:hypothetical protein
VYVGALGVRGGGNTCPYAHAVRARDSSSEEGESNNDYEVYSGNYRFYRTTAGNWDNSRYWVRSETPVPALSANDVRAVSWYFHDCSAAYDRGDCLYPSADFNHIRRMAERRREERRERRERKRQEAARRREEERKRQEEEERKKQEDLKRRREEFRKQVEDCRRELQRREEVRLRQEQEEERKRQEEARRREEERKRQEEEERKKQEDLKRRREEFRKQVEDCRRELQRREEVRLRQEEERRRQEEAEAKRAADGQVWAEQVGTQAAALAATQAGFEQFWNESSAIQKRLSQMHKATQAMPTPQAMRQKYVQEYMGTPIFEGAMLEPVDRYDDGDEASSVVAVPLSHEASVAAPLEAEEHPVPVGLAAEAAEGTSKSAASSVHGSTNAPDADNDVISPSDDEHSQSEASSIYDDDAAFSEDEEDFASACAGVVAPSDTDDTDFAPIGLNDTLAHVELGWDRASGTQGSALAAGPTPHSGVEQTVPCEPEDTPNQRGLWAAVDTQPQVAQQGQPSVPPAFTRPPFNPLQILRQVAKAIVVPFDNRPLAPLTQAVNAVVMQLKQYPSCTTPLGMLLTKGEEVMRLLQQQPYAPTLDFNERVLRKTLEEKLSCHLRLYQCVAYWSQHFTDAERDAFEAVIIPIFKKHFLCADTAVQQALLAYWGNGGSCYTDILQDAAVADWLAQSLCLDIAQEALVNNNTLLRDQFMQSIWRLVQHKQGPAQQKLLNQLLWSLRARQQAYQLDLLTLCKLMEWLPADGDQAMRLLNNAADDWSHTLKVHWIATYLEAFKNRYQEEELSALCSLLSQLPWDKAITNSFLSAVDAAQDYTAVKDFLLFLKQYPSKKVHCCMFFMPNCLRA